MPHSLLILCEFCRLNAGARRDLSPLFVSFIGVCWPQIAVIEPAKRAK
jgi:hypothetical protein